MCQFFSVSRSGYYDYVKRQERQTKDAMLGELIRQCQDCCRKTYGYRRVHQWLIRKQHLHLNPKTVLRVMNKYGLLAEIRRRRKYKQMGQQLHRYENLLNRDFTATKPNTKWVTDISYIRTDQGVLYLSVIRDLFDRSIIAHKTGTTQTVNLVLQTIRTAVQKEAVVAELHLHSDQGFQYTSQAYLNLTTAYGITPSMSRRGNCYDNAVAENFFSILKAECIYRQKIHTFEQAKQLIDEYVDFYNHERIQAKTGLTPLEKRRQTV